MSDTTTSKPTASEAFPCPHCGATEWKADYYEAVWQTISLVVGDDGEPELADYTGVTGTYDDPSTDDEAYRCASCDHTIQLGTFRLLPAELPPFEKIVGWLANARTALNDPAAIDTAALAPFVEQERRLAPDEQPPPGAYLYTLHQLDEAINALRRIYEPEEVAAES
jgi:hypothetical protein